MTPEEEFWALPEWPEWEAVVLTPQLLAEWEEKLGQRDWTIVSSYLPKMGHTVNLPKPPQSFSPSKFGDKAIVMATDKAGVVWGRGLGSRHRL